MTHSSTNTITDIKVLEDRLAITNSTAADLRALLKTATGQEAKDHVHGISVLEAEARKIRRRLRHLRSQVPAERKPAPDLPTDPAERKAWLQRMNELLYGKEEDE